MSKRYRNLAGLITLALALMACQLLPQVAKPITASANAGTASSTEKVNQIGKGNPTETQSQKENNPTSVAGVMPPQSQAAGIQPKAMRTTLTHLSNLIGYRVLDVNGNKLGIASDFIVNTRETYIIYIMMEPDASLNIPAGNRVLIPFEVVTINSGVLNAQNKTIQLHLSKEAFSGAPTLSVGQQLTPTDWEGATIDFWKKWARIAVLRTSCNAGSGPTYKVAYATQLLGVKLYDGLNKLLGTVQEAILEPESGQIGFYLIKPVKGNGLVMISLGRTNIPKEALDPGATLKLVLLADPSVFWGAPRITSIDQADNFSEQGKMRGYWK